jgi:peptidoglycan/xylan/chitin deacetylase (PgdA/CDA1 family)
MVIAKPVYGKLFIFFADCDLCKERSTKRNDRAVAAGWKYPHGGDETVASGSPFLARAGLELAYLSGYSRLMQRRTGGAGVILRFERVRPRRTARFQPLQACEITPRFLDRAIGALKRWKFDIVSMDEVCRRAVTLASPRRFVCLTFDGGYKDMITSAYPVLAKHGVPFTIYVPTAFPDRLGEAWWLALEEVVARENRISLVMDGREQRFDVGDTSEKYQLYDFLAGWMRALPPPDLSVAINDLCKRYSVNLAALSREAMMGWDDLTRLAADPLVTMASATVNYPVLSNLRDADALREMAMGRAVAEAAFQRDVRHFAYPFGDRAAFGRQHVGMAEEAGFASAVSAISGVVRTEGRTNLHALPRIAWDGRRRSLRVMRVLLSGVTFPRPTSQQPRHAPSPTQLGFTRVGHRNLSKSDISDFDGRGLG